VRPVSHGASCCQYARKLLRTTRLADLSLGEIAKRAKVAKDRLFFYDDFNACVSA